MDISRVRPVRTSSRLPWITAQVLVVLAGALTYFLVRGATEASAGLARAHAAHLLDLERALHVDVEARFQSAVESSETVETLGNWIYIWGHWPVLIATMVWLVSRHRPQFLPLRDAMLISGFLGMLVFVSYPVAPPRLMPGYVDTVTESSDAYRYLQPPPMVNQYAAMPSLHVGWAVLIFYVVASTGPRLVGVLAGIYAATTLTVVVITANHWWLDGIVAVAILVMCAWGVYGVRTAWHAAVARNSALRLGLGGGVRVDRPDEAHIGA